MSDAIDIGKDISNICINFVVGFFQGGRKYQNFILIVFGVIALVVLTLIGYMM